MKHGGRWRYGCLPSGPGQALRLKRAILVIDRLRVVRHVAFPVLDIPQAVEDSPKAVRSLTR
ncbi:hypothetical protein ACTWPT_46325 [Nonomuraea sp. 3N208]|uniref:hypothetical protein n=1 Tax=Nonomuraea sp. 3N208 TaxID=3457421 RepID=UPI003FCF93D1